MDHALIERPRGLQGRIKSALLSWLGVPVELTNHAFWNEFTGGGANSGERVTVSTALRISAVWACVRLLSETISTMPIVLYRRTPERAIATAHPLYLILHDAPNPDMTAVTFWETVLASMLLWGNAYALIHRAGGNVVALEFLRPEQMQLRRLSNGAIEYRWITAGKTQTAIDSDVLHIPAFTTDGLMGLSPVGYAVNVLGNAIAAERASGTVFRKGLMLSGTFKTANTVQEKHREAFRARLEEYRGAINSGSAPLLEAGIEYAPLAINPNDAQLLETRAFSIEEICRWYRVPPFMIGHSEKSTSWGSGIEQQMLGFLTFSLRPWLKRIEQSVNRKLLTVLERRDLYCEFNFEALLRADSAGRAAFYSMMVQNGIYSRNEVRGKENLAPRPGADDLTAQVNLAPLSMLGQSNQQASQQAAQAFRIWLGIDQEHNAGQSKSAPTTE